MPETKPIEQLIFSDEVRYSKEHAWARRTGDRLVVGISDFAQDQLGDVIFVELPQAGDRFDSNAEFGMVESAKASNDLFMPVGGAVTLANTDLEDSPGLINSEPYDGGWLLEIEPADPSEFDRLMSSAEYKKYLETI